jgi:hypothetical protein
MKRIKRREKEKKAREAKTKRTQLWNSYWLELGITDCYFPENFFSFYYFILFYSFPYL